MPEDSTEELSNRTALIRYKTELEQELNAIVNYWIDHAVDKEQGGFYGAVNNDNMANPAAPKGVVLNSRILWTFSAASRYVNHPSCLATAKRAFNYIIEHFIDPEYGGVFWTVDQLGKMLDGKKQVYGLAFCLYGMAEYYHVTGDEKALQIARDMFDTIERFSFDKAKGGYLEAFTREWGAVDDLRLSKKDSNEKKTMNTHLHVLEAYTNLYRIWPDGDLYKRIVLLIENFTEHIVNRHTGHLQLFFDEAWNVKGNIISYGHDIEAAWLLLEAAEVINDKDLVQQLKANAVKMADAAAEGLDKDGGLWYEVENNHLVRQKHSWPQAEAMVGFFAAWEISGDKKYLQWSLHNWAFTKRYIVDKKKGEWFWGIEADHQPMQGTDKVGLWKCPYHNSRACMEIIRRIK